MSDDADELLGPGRGTTITAMLPLATKKCTEASHAVSRAVPDGASVLAGLKVLLVDDEEDAREAMRRILQQNGMSVITAASAREGFELLERLKPDLPSERRRDARKRMGSPSFVGCVFSRSKAADEPRTAALSAYAGVEARRKALLAGFQYHIPKPVDPDRLLDVIAAMARKRIDPR